jgi:outer membrane protein assembly factor BamB
VRVRYNGGTLDDITFHVSTEPELKVGDFIQVGLTDGDGSTYRVLNNAQGVTFLNTTLAIGPLYAFLGARWYRDSIPAPYFINENGTGDTNGEFDAVQAAVNTWNNVGCNWADFSYQGTTSATPGARDGLNIIGWLPDDQSPCPGVVACAPFWSSNGRMLEADIVFDENKTYSIGGVYDIQAITTHEFGHNLGLNHSENSGAVMFPTYPGGTRWRTLTQDDIDGICALYSNQAPSLPSLSSPNNGQTMNQSSVRLSWTEGWDDDFPNATPDYWIQVDDTADFSSPIRDTGWGYSGTFFDLTALVDGTYYWRVNQGDGEKNSGWTDPFWFVVSTVEYDTTPPDGFVSAPADGATLKTSPVPFTADAWDNPGGSGVQVVEFHVNYDKTWHQVGTDTSAPYAVDWAIPAGLAAQQLIFTIHVIDSAGNERMDPGGYHSVAYQPVLPCSDCGLANTAWPMHRGDVRRTGQSQLTGPDDPEVKWTFTSENVSTAPAIGADGTLYLGMDNDLVALNPDGTLKWSFTASKDFSTWAPAITQGGRVIAGNGNGNLYAFSSNGTLDWTYATGSWISGSPAITADGTIYFGSSNGQLISLNQDGSLKWAYTGGLWIHDPSVGPDGSVYFGGTDRQVHAVKPDGSQKWVYATQGFVDTAPVVGLDGTLYAGSSDGFLYALRSSDGALVWKYQSPGHLPYSAALASDGTIYIASEDADTQDGFEDAALLALAPDGTLKWRYSFDENAFCSPTIGADGTIYISANNGFLYAFRRDGTIKWQIPLETYSRWLQINPVIGGNQMVYVTSRWPAKLYAVGNSTAHPVPVLTSVTPTGISAGSSDFTLTVTGSNFVSSSVVRWNGSDLNTHYISPSYLTALVPAGRVASAGSAVVAVYNPAPGGGTTDGQLFTINAAGQTDKKVYLPQVITPQKIIPVSSVLIPFDVNQSDLVGPSNWSGNYGKTPELVVASNGISLDVLAQDYDDATAWKAVLLHIQPRLMGSGYVVTQALTDLPFLDRVMGLAIDGAGNRYYATGVNESQQITPQYPPLHTYRENIVRVIKLDAAGNVLFNIDLDTARYTFNSGAEMIINPMVAATSRLAVGGNEIALVHGINTGPDWGINGTRHQKALSTRLDAATGAVTRVSSVWASHSFDQRLLFDGEGIIEQHLGDAYPRYITMGRNHEPYPLFQIKGALGENNTYTRLGNMALIDNNPEYRYIAVFVTESTAALFSEIINGPRNLGFVRIKNSDNSIDPNLPDILTVDSEGSQVTNRLRWLTSYTPESRLHAERPKLVAIGGNRYVVLWEEWQQGIGNWWEPEEFNGVYAMLIDDQGNLLRPATRLTADCHLPRGDDAFLLDGQAGWLTGDANDKTLSLHLVDANLNYQTVIIE